MVFAARTGEVATMVMGALRAPPVAAASRSDDADRQVFNTISPTEGFRPVLLGPVGRNGGLPIIEMTDLSAKARPRHRHLWSSRAADPRHLTVICSSLPEDGG
jgi:hypothetical protein